MVRRKVRLKIRGSVKGCENPATPQLNQRPLRIPAKSALAEATLWDPAQLSDAVSLFPHHWSKSHRFKTKDPLRGERSARGRDDCGNSLAEKLQ